MPENVDDQFYNRADGHIRLSNQQVPLFGPRPTTESMIYGAARFAVWYVTTNTATSAELEAKSAAEIERYTQMFKSMMEENMQDHINRFETLKGLK